MMNERINKPKVFLSHSKKNIEFIERLANDLRKSLIEPWLDTDEIRHGKSWQDSIFELGLPTCDAIIVYFTELSIQSSVVKKEMDVGLLQNLKDNNIAFLPYVSDEKLRIELRPDIQALQVPEWNDKNYYILLPRVVAEIWRSYLERSITSAVQTERLRRVEAELELEKLKGQPDDVFTKSENREFEFIWDYFNKAIPFRFTQSVWDSEYKVKHRFQGVLYLATCVALLSDLFNEYGFRSGLHAQLSTEVLRLINAENNDASARNDIEGIPNIMDDLLTHGLVEKLTFTTVDEYRSERVNYTHEISKKYYRFRYWLAYHKNLPLRIKVEVDPES